MSPKSLNELEFKNETMPTAGQSLDDLPTFGSFAPPPQPGPFRFKLPAVMEGMWELFDSTRTNPPGQRLRVIFDQDHPLTIVQSKDGKYNGEPFMTRLSSEERGRGKGKEITASDVDYLLRAFQEKLKPANSKGYIDLLKKHAGKEFGADIRYSWRCDTKRNIRVEVKDPATGQRTEVKEVDNQAGCDNAFYQEDVPRGPDGLMPTELTCQCGALLRAFANLDNMRA